MYVVEVTFLIQNKMEDTGKILEKIDFLLGALRMNGQIVTVRIYLFQNKTRWIRVELILMC